jgi:IS5 family transposase
MKVHVGTDPRGIVHSLTGTDAATAELSQLPALGHGQERTLYGDQAYWNEAHRQHWTASGGRYRVRPPCAGSMRMLQL